MSLPTPPTTSHREKENKSLASRGVVWSQQDHWQVHCLSTPPQGPKCSSASQERPVKSILKPTQPILPLPEEDIREETPAPSDPLTDSKYLESPMTTILSEDASIPDLIRAYSILTARIRPCVSEWADHSSPLFEPLRVNRDVLCDRICRDVKRALEDALGEDEEERLQKEHRLPSPTKSPKKKKRGMTAEQAKHARDLCTISHSVLKLLGLLLGLPNVFRIFTDQQLTQMLSGILSIPLATDLPTPNARKTYALSIYVIQTQRLPEVVLFPSKDSIACALGRGIDGELGKEGKKGSASDGLKAIHDLSTYQPRTFVPAFVVILDSILDNLLAPTLTLRLQACHALGGLAQGTLVLPPSALHARLSSRIVEFLLTVPRASPKKSVTSSPTKQESAICRTLRTTLNVEEPLHVASGPVWGLHVLGSFIILLGSAFKTDPRVTRTISNLMILTMRHKKVAVRKLGCIVWRTIIWSWHQLPFPLPSDDDETVVKFSKEERNSASLGQWAMIEKVLSMGVGISTCCAIVGYELTSMERMRLERILSLMVNKSEETREDALLCIIQLSSLDPQASSWDVDHLISRNFFSGITGILTADYQELSKSLSPIRDELPDIRDLRPLTRDELLDVGAMKVFLELWSSAICIRDGQQSNEDLLVETWDAMLKSMVTMAEDDGEEGELKATHRLSRALYGSLRTSPKNTSSNQEYHFDLAKNLRIIRRAWLSMRSVLSKEYYLEEYALEMLKRLEQFEDGELSEIDDQARIEWAGLCVDLILASEDPASNVREFWEHADSRWNWSTTVRTTVWAKFSKQKIWEGSKALLCVPFCSETVWDLNDEELSIWESLLKYVMNLAEDDGMDIIHEVDSIACTIQQKCNPTFTSLVRIADMLITSVLESSRNAVFQEITELPDNLVEFIADTLNQSYPPSPSTGFSSAWMIRSIQWLLNSCPDHLYLDLLETLQESVVRWISDEQSALVDCYDDITTLYENLLMKLLDTAPPTRDSMERFRPILESLFIGPAKPISAFDAFDTFWRSSAVPPQFWPKKVYEYIHRLPGALTTTSSLSTPPAKVVEDCEESEERGGSIGTPKSTSEKEGTGVGVTSSSEPTLVPAPDLPSSPELPSSPALEFPDSPTPSHPRESEDHFPLLLPAPNILSTPPRASKAKGSPSTVSLRSVPKTPDGSGTHRFNSLFAPETPSSPSKPPPQHLAPSPIIKPYPPASPLASANKRRRITDKENHSPYQTISSPSRRDRDVFTQDSPSRRPSTVCRKRLFTEMSEAREEEVDRERSDVLDPKREERPAKRVRITTPIPPFVLPLPHQAPTTVAAMEEASTPTSTSLSQKAPPPLSIFSDSDVVCGSALPLRRTASTPRKRKAMVLDCVEIRVPHSKSVKSSAVTGARPMRTPANRMSKKGKQAKDTAKVGQKSVTMAPPVEGLGDPDADFHLESDIEVFSDSDSGSDRSTKQLSSDDDPYLGQVTPGHLISPALRRARKDTLDDDPPSDDSSFGGEEVSPSRQVVLRRMQRTPSAAVVQRKADPASEVSTIATRTSPLKSLRHLLTS
ncbi:hypothetical protein BT96DRAFT_915898 [Gymnopus androsaceus JB14]|uniref:Telomere-associated protein Rif1 N-terminal domain-containing protein n=1 Tax=Gymnopus androsaceus JB14 TaxID=1447944 RepID=A0A6A4I8K3_9AGAR|nr:hypothetical protein BT96DRAFT_915898 [Gymnopus androsaceus JB14]